MKISLFTTGCIRTARDTCTMTRRCATPDTVTEVVQENQDALAAKTPELTGD